MLDARAAESKSLLGSPTVSRELAAIDARDRGNCFSADRGRPALRVLIP